MTPRLGKLPAKADGRTLRLESYLVGEEFPMVPAARDWTYGMSRYDADPLGNVEAGDCAYAAPGHAITLASQLVGLPSPVTAAGILAAYSAGTGYDPAKPETDRGAYMLDVLKQWRNDGICGHRCEAFVSVSIEQIPLAAALFGGVLLGLQLPETIWGEDIWTATGGQLAGGHAVFVHAYSPEILVCNTWGQRRPMRSLFVQRQCDEAYAVLMADRPAPCGLDLEALRADLARL